MDDRHCINAYRFAMNCLVLFCFTYCIAMNCQLHWIAMNCFACPIWSRFLLANTTMAPSPPHRLFHRRHNLFLRTVRQISGKHLCYSRLLYTWFIDHYFILVYLFVLMFSLYLYLFHRTAWLISSKHLCSSLFPSHLLEINKANDNHIRDVQILL